MAISAKIASTKTEAKKTAAAIPVKTWRDILSKEDLVLVGLISGGLFAILLVCLLLPSSSFVIDPAARLMGEKAKAGESSDGDSNSGGGGNAAADAKGIYALGKMQLTLGSASSYVDSDIDLEYDRGVLRISSNGEIEDNSSANRFFKDKQNKIKDAIVMKSSDFSGPEVQGTGIGSFKTHLIQAINDTINVNNDLVTNIYFRKFILFPQEND